MVFLQRRGTIAAKALFEGEVHALKSRIGLDLPIDVLRLAVTDESAKKGDGKNNKKLSAHGMCAVPKVLCK